MSPQNDYLGGLLYKEPYTEEANMYGVCTTGQKVCIHLGSLATRRADAFQSDFICRHNLGGTHFALPGFTNRYGPHCFA